MKKWLANLIDKYQRFMYGRYGSDRLSLFISVATLILLLLSMIRPLWFCIFIAVFLSAWSVFRSLSRNIYKRRKELAAYTKIRDAVQAKLRLWRDMWRDRKTHRYYICPKCKAVIRIPKPPRGHKIGLTCPRCFEKFDRRGR